jgi:site-specific DNA-methyltransferase (adenine-specific)
MTTELPTTCGAAVRSSDWLGRIVCGDNTEVLSGFPAECVDLVVTSPPYDDLRTYGGHSWNFETLAAQLVRVLKPGGVIVWVVNDATVDGSETGTSMRQYLHFQTLGLNLHDTMIWSKPGFTAVGALQTRYAPTFEFMFVVSKGKPKTFNPIKDRKSIGGTIHGTIRQKDGSTKPVSNNGKVYAEYGQRFNVWEINPDQNEHPAPFPETMVKDHITSWSNPGDVVIDPFSGSGTTCKAAKELNRLWCGIEINPKYCAMAEGRLS